MANVTPATTYTLDDFIQMKNVDNITYYNFSTLEVIDGVHHLDTNLIEEYLDELKRTCIPVTLSFDEMKKYKYNPDLLAYDLYGSVQLDFILLLINDMIDPKDFIKNSIILPYSSGLSVFLNTVFTKEQEYIRQNRIKNNLNTIL